jgi:hypothetical protein
MQNSEKHPKPFDKNMLFAQKIVIISFKTFVQNVFPRRKFIPKNLKTFKENLKLPDTFKTVQEIKER